MNKLFKRGNSAIAIDVAHSPDEGSDLKKQGSSKALLKAPPSPGPRSSSPTRASLDVPFIAPAPLKPATSQEDITAPLDPYSKWKKDTLAEEISRPDAVNVSNKSLQAILKEYQQTAREEFSTTHELVLLYKRTQNAQLKSDIIKLSEHLITSFKLHPTKKPTVLANVTPLAGLVDAHNTSSSRKHNAQYIVTTLFSVLFDEIKDSKSVFRPWMFEGLADALKLVDPIAVSEDTLRTILDAVNSIAIRMHDTENLSEKTALLSVFARVIDTYVSKFDESHDQQETKQPKSPTRPRRFMFLEAFQKLNPNPTSSPSTVRLDRAHLTKGERDGTLASFDTLDIPGPIDYRFNLWFARQQVYYLISADEPPYFFAYRLAVEMVNAVSTLLSIVLKHGCALSEYVELLKSAKAITSLIQNKQIESKKRDRLWPVLVKAVQTLVKNIDQSADERTDLIELIKNASNENEWHFKYGVMSAIQNVLRESQELDGGKNEELSSVICDLILHIFSRVENVQVVWEEETEHDEDDDEVERMPPPPRRKSSARKKSTFGSDEVQPNYRELSKICVRTLVLMSRTGSENMREHALMTLNRARFALRKANRDLNLFDEVLVGATGNEAIGAIGRASDEQLTKSVRSERQREQAEFFNESRRAALPLESIIAEMRQVQLSRLKDLNGRGGELALYVETLCSSIKGSKQENKPENYATSQLRLFLLHELWKLHKTMPLANSKIFHLLQSQSGGISLQTASEEARTILVLQGGAGSGKSLLIDFVLNELLENYEWAGPIPLLVSLPTIKDPTKDVILQTLLSHGCTSELARKFKETRSFILFMDGFDEIHGSKSPWQTDHLYEWSLALVISVRTEYVDSLRSRTIFHSGYNDHAGKPPHDIFLTPFDTLQCTTYWNKLNSFLNRGTSNASSSSSSSTTPKIKLSAKPSQMELKRSTVVALGEFEEVDPAHQSDVHASTSLISLASAAKSWDAKKYEDTINNITGLKELLATPFILTIVTVVLPTMREIQSGLKLQRSDIYEAFLSFWYLRTEERLRRNRTKVPDRFNARMSFEEFGRDLAFSMLLTSQFSITSQLGTYVMQTEETKYWSRFFDSSKPEVLTSMLGVPLRWDGQRISFIHKSVQEFLAAQAIVDVIRLGNESGTLGEHSPLNKKLVVSELSILSFVAEMLSSRPYLIEGLYYVVIGSANRPEIAIAAANAATLLSILAFPFDRRDLRGIHIAGADLSYAFMVQADLRGADLRRVNFQQACLDGALLDEAKLDDITLGELPSLPHPTSVTCVSFASDSKTVVSGGEDGYLRVWNIETVQQLHLLTGHTAKICSVAWSPDDKFILSGSADFNVFLWSLESPDQPIQRFAGHGNVISAACFLAKGIQIVTAGWDSVVQIWDIKSTLLLHQLTGHTGKVLCLATSKDGKYIASGGEDPEIRLWNSSKGLIVKCFEGHTHPVLSVAFSSSGQQLVSSSTRYGKDVGSSMILWNIASGDLIRKMDIDSGSVYSVFSVSFSPDDKFIASGSNDHAIRLWAADTGQTLRQLDGHTAPVLYLTYSPDGKHIISCSTDTSVRLWSAKIMQQLRPFEGHSKEVRSVAISPDGRHVISGGGSSMRVWGAQKGTQVHSLEGHTSTVYSVAYSIDGSGIAVSGSADKTVRVWNAQRGEFIKDLIGHTGEVRAVALSPSSDIVGSGGTDTSIRLWELSTGKQLLQLTEHAKQVNSLCFAHVSERLCSGSDDHTIRVWDVTSGANLLTLKGHSDAVLAVCYSYDDNLIISSSKDKTARIWHAQSGQELKQLQDITAEIECVACTPNGLHVVTGSVNKLVELFDLKTGQRLVEYVGHNARVSSVAVSRDSQYLASSSADKSIRLWSLQNVPQAPSNSVPRAFCVRIIAAARSFSCLHLSMANTQNLSFIHQKVLQQRGAIASEKDDVEEQPVLDHGAGASVITAAHRWQTVRASFIVPPIERKPQRAVNIDSRVGLIEKKLNGLEKTMKDVLQLLQTVSVTTPSATRPPEVYKTRSIGVLNTIDYAVYIENDHGQIISALHDVPLFANEAQCILNMIVQAPRWSNAKLQICKEVEFNPIRPEVINGQPCYVKNYFPYHGYIWNYGVPPQTWSNQLEVCEIGSVVFQTGTIKQVKVLGIVGLVNERETTWKLIAIETRDPLAPKLNDIGDVDIQMPGLLRATETWFRSHQIHDSKVAFEGKEFATRIIYEAHAAWRRLVMGQVSTQRNSDIKLTNLTIHQSPFNTKQSALVAEGNPKAAAQVDPMVHKWHFTAASKK